VGIVTICPKIIINITPKKPIVPTAYPNRRKRKSPRIVEKAEKKTGAVPNYIGVSISVLILVG
jgi:hypothetical protein